MLEQLAGGFTYFSFHIIICGTLFQPGSSQNGGTPKTTRLGLE